jgi:hypothetical protein
MITNRRRPFLEGIVGAFDLFGVLHRPRLQRRYNIDRYHPSDTRPGAAKDAEALREDWDAIGRDFQRVFDDFQRVFDDFAGRRPFSRPVDPQDKTSL